METKNPDFLNESLKECYLNPFLVYKIPPSIEDLISINDRASIRIRLRRAPLFQANKKYDLKIQIPNLVLKKLSFKLEIISKLNLNFDK